MPYGGHDFLRQGALAWTLTWDADWVTSVCFLGTTRRLAAGNNLGQILLWELPDKGRRSRAQPRAPSRRAHQRHHAPRGHGGRPLADLGQLRSHHPLLGHADRAAKGKEPLVLNARAIADAEARKEKRRQSTAAARRPRLPSQQSARTLEAPPRMDQRPDARAATTSCSSAATMPATSSSGSGQPARN